MKTRIVIVAFSLLLLLDVVYSKNYTKCGLTYEFIKYFPRIFVGNWVCLVQSESYMDTSLVTKRASGGDGLGLFQIKSKDGWCTYKKPGGKCNIKCEDLTNDQIEDDTKCAQIIQTEKGFQYWSGWVRGCKARNPIPIPKEC